MTDRTEKRLKILQNKKLDVTNGPCYYTKEDDPAHEDCQITTYAVAQRAHGQKAHRMFYTFHSGTQTIYGSALPYCGSRRGPAAFYDAQIVDAVTCERCGL